MSDKRTFQVRRSNPRARQVAELAMQEVLQQSTAGADFDVTISEPRRTLAENALLHALISELARKLEWAGKRRDAETWKRLLVAAWYRAEGKALEILPALDGHGVDIVPVRTSRLSKRDCADLIEFVQWWGAEQGVRWDEHRAVA